MSKGRVVIYCIQYITFTIAGIIAGITVFNSSAMAIFLGVLASFIAQISFYIEAYVKDMY